MRKLLALLLIASILLLGCKKEGVEHPPPTIQLISGAEFVSVDTLLKLGEEFKVGINAANPNVNLTNFIIKVETNEIETFVDSGMNTPTLHYEKYVTKGISELEKWTFIIRDKDGRSSEVTLNIGLDNTGTYGSINYYPDIILGAQNNSLNSFYSIDNDTYSLSEAFQNQDLIDLCYYYDFIDTDENTIASPGANIDASVYPGNEGLEYWTVRRESRFKLVDVSEEDFLNASNDSLLLAAHGVADGKRKAKNLATGNTFAFKNDDGRIGLFRVNSISGTDEGEVNISIKVQVK